MKNPPSRLIALLGALDRLFGFSLAPVYLRYTSFWTGEVPPPETSQIQNNRTPFWFSFFSFCHFWSCGNGPWIFLCVIESPERLWHRLPYPLFWEIYAIIHNFSSFYVGIVFYFNIKNRPRGNQNYNLSIGTPRPPMNDKLVCQYQKAVHHNLSCWYGVPVPDICSPAIAWARW